ncbi:MAG: acyl-[ACP]--phospholipid O-acyltransferase, partial [Planctomycetota bacterium]|jgi:acyl-[acyl-carrier-protein]-phospholipid O-acyltransferase/long-chain-fatty-acid--[acyl-carrier-protein] ligase
MSDTQLKLPKSFTWLNITQFLGALNDNMFKLFIVAFIIGMQGPASASRVSALAGAVFVIPFLIFLAQAGKLADRFSKRDITVCVKIAELIIMTLGVVAFFLKSPVALYIILFLMAAQSTFFSPSKYGIIPELVKKEQLSKANSYLEALTYLAIVISAVFVPLLLMAANEIYTLAAMGCIVIAAVGWLTSTKIERTQPGGVKKGVSVLFIRDIFKTLWSIHRKTDLLLTVFASAYFLLIGAFLMINLFPYAIQHLDMNEVNALYLSLPAAIGIGAGSFLAGKLSGRHIEMGLVPVGALGLTVFTLALSFITAPLFWPLLFVFFVGASAGLYIVPIHAFIQLKSPRVRRGQILAASSFLGWVGVLLASGLLYVLSELLGLTAAQAFLVVGLITLVLAVATTKLLLEFLVRFLFVLLTRLFYRIKVTGIENVPTTGPVLLVCNHAAYVDALLLNATQQRRIRFVMDKNFYNKPFIKSISSSDPPKKLVTSLRQARSAMDEGFIVCIFAEGAMTRTGMLYSFKSGFEKIMKGTSYSIVPSYIGGSWGSIFSYFYGKPLSTLPKKIRLPIGIHFGKPVPANSTAAQIRQQVMELSCDYFNSLKSTGRSLADNFVQVARKNWRRRCISDSSSKSLKYGEALISSIALSKQITEITKNQDCVGILIPPSVGAALTNIAATLSKKVTVNLNYTLSPQALKVPIGQCELKCIISSKTFLEKQPHLKQLDNLVFLEDLASKINSGEKLKSYLKARFVPRFLLTRPRKFSADDLATIIFSSGSSGSPKGIMLSHHNVFSNIEAVRTIFHFTPDDSLCGILPFFHSFGFTAALWLPVVTGVSAGYIPNPLDSASVAKVARENRSTVLFTVPSFLLQYTRRVPAEDFSNLRYVLAGAEKLKERIADLFEKKFSIRPMEGYGATELSPIVSLNVHDREVGGVRQIGNKPGTIGHPIPGVAAKIVDIETSESLPFNTEGLLFITGPNVMLGYLNKPERTSQVIQDGWYNTGDIAKMDEDGFLTITDRLSRFSKIAGEMVPHLGIEDFFHKKLDAHDQLITVTSVPDPKKGEELVVLYLSEAGDSDKLHKIIADSDLPNIWKPKRQNYIEVSEIPRLGSGKINIAKIKQIALEAKSIQIDR